MPGGLFQFLEFDREKLPVSTLALPVGSGLGRPAVSPMNAMVMENLSRFAEKRDILYRVA